MLQFTQEEVEKEMADCLPHGSRRDVARIAQLGESNIKRQFNPDDETASCVFRTLQVGCALDELDPDLGDRFWLTIMRFRDLSKKRRQTGDASSSNTDSGKLAKEIADFVAVKLADAPIGVQMKELLEAEVQLAKVKQDLIDEYQLSPVAVTAEALSVSVN